MAEDTKEDQKDWTAEFEQMPDEKIKSVVGKAMAVLDKREKKKRASKKPSEMSNDEFRNHVDQILEK